MWGLSKKVTICKLRREPSTECNHTGTLILDFQLPELWENPFLSMKYFVRAAKAQGARQWLGFVTNTILLTSPRRNNHSSFPWYFWSLSMQTNQFRSLTLYNLCQKDLTMDSSHGQCWAKTKEDSQAQLGADILEINILKLKQTLTGPTHGMLSENKANFQMYKISNEIRPNLASPSLYEHEKFPSRDHASIPPSLPIPKEVSLSLFFSCITNKFKAVVGTKSKSRTTRLQILIFIFIGCFWKGTIWETWVVIPALQRCEGSVPTIAMHLETKAWSPRKAFSLVPTQAQTLENAIPSTEKGRYQHENQTSSCLFWEWFSHWA